MDRQMRLVTIFGGSGFIGTQLVQALARRGWRVRVAVRRPDLAGHLRPLGAVGQVQPVQANVRDDASVAAAVEGAEAVVNLVGIGLQRGRQRFESVHVEGARRIALAARAAGVERLVHMSAIGADPASESEWARSRAAAEAAASEGFPDAIVMRASIVFGPGDGFLTLLASLAQRLPVFPLISGGTRFQPVYVGDVAEALARAVEGNAVPGAVYELGGPSVVTHRELVERVLAETMRRRPVLPLSPGIARLLAMPMGLLPSPLLTADQVTLLGRDNVVSSRAEKAALTLAGLGIAPTGLDAVLPSYLWRFRPRGEFDRAPA